MRSLSSSTRDGESVEGVRAVDMDVATFSSRLISLLHGGEVEGDKRREGVGGVSEREMAAARTGLLEALQSTESQPLSPEVYRWSRQSITWAGVGHECIPFLQKAVSVLCQHYQELRNDMGRRLALISVLSSDLAVSHSTIQYSVNKLTQLHSEV